MFMNLPQLEKVVYAHEYNYTGLIDHIMCLLCFVTDILQFYEKDCAALSSNLSI